MGLSYFWFIAAAVIGAMDLYFGNFFLLVISAAAFTTALFSFFLSSVYLQVAIFTVISLLVISYFDAFAASLEKNVDLLFRKFLRPATSLD